MRTHIEIVSVTYRRGKTGERVPALVSDTFTINRPDPDDAWPDNLPLYNWSGHQVDTWPPATHHDGQNAYLDLPTDWYGFRFQFFGQFFDHEQSALELECDSVSAEDTFGDFVERLRAIGDKLLDGRGADGYEPPREVTFLTAWTYTSDQDYEGGWDHEWDLIGLVDLWKIEAAIVKVAA